MFKKNIRIGSVIEQEKDLYDGYVVYLYNRSGTNMGIEDWVKQGADTVNGDVFAPIKIVIEIENEKREFFIEVKNKRWYTQLRYDVAQDLGVTNVRLYYNGQELDRYDIDDIANIPKENGGIQVVEVNNEGPLQKLDNRSKAERAAAMQEAEIDAVERNVANKLADALVVMTRGLDEKETILFLASQPDIIRIVSRILISPETYNADSADKEAYNKFVNKFNLDLPSLAAELTQKINACACSGKWGKKRIKKKKSNISSCMSIKSKLAYYKQLFCSCCLFSGIRHELKKVWSCHKTKSTPCHTKQFYQGYNSCSSSASSCSSEDARIIHLGTQYASSEESDLTDEQQEPEEEEEGEEEEGEEEDSDSDGSEFKNKNNYYDENEDTDDTDEGEYEEEQYENDLISDCFNNFKMKTTKVESNLPAMVPINNFMEEQPCSIRNAFDMPSLIPIESEEEMPALIPLNNTIHDLPPITNRKFKVQTNEKLPKLVPISNDYDQSFEDSQSPKEMPALIPLNNTIHDLPPITNRKFKVQTNEKLPKLVPISNDYDQSFEDSQSPKVMSITDDLKKSEYQNVLENGSRFMSMYKADGFKLNPSKKFHIFVPSNQVISSSMVANISKQPKVKKDMFINSYICSASNSKATGTQSLQNNTRDRKFTFDDNTLHGMVAKYSIKARAIDPNNPNITYFLHDALVNKMARN